MTFNLRYKHIRSRTCKWKETLRELTTEFHWQLPQILNYFVSFNLIYLLCFYSVLLLPVCWLTPFLAKRNAA